MYFLAKWTLAVYPDADDPGAQILLRPGLEIRFRQSGRQPGVMVPVEVAGQVYLVEAGSLRLAVSSSSGAASDVSVRS